MKTPTPKTVAIALAILVGATLLIYAPFHIRHLLQQDRFHLALIEQQIENLQNIGRRLQKENIAVAKAAESVNLARELAEKELGATLLASIEKPLCDTWKESATQAGFKTVGCQETSDRWTRVVLVGPQENKRELYDRLESNLHPVTVRTVLVDNKKKGKVKITLIVRDRYHFEIKIPTPHHIEFLEQLKFDPPTVMFRKSERAKLLETIAKLDTAIRDYIRDADNMQTDIRHKGYLLRAIDRHKNNGLPRQFDLESEEKKNKIPITIK